MSPMAIMGRDAQPRMVCMDSGKDPSWKLLKESSEFQGNVLRDEISQESITMAFYALGYIVFL